MKVKEVSATIKYSKQLPAGGWANCELGATADVAPGEDWNTAQSILYGDLKRQLATLFHARACPETAAQTPNGFAPSQITTDAKGRPECPQHHRTMNSKNGGVFCPVKTDGEYCAWKVSKKELAQARGEEVSL